MGIQARLMGGLAVAILAPFGCAAGFATSVDGTPAPLWPVTIEFIAPHLAPIDLGTSCDTGDDDQPTGDFAVATGFAPIVGTGETQIRYLVEVENGLEVDLECFADVVELTLSDHRSWIGDGRWSFARVADPGLATMRVTLADPSTVDRECRPLLTGGIYSCWNGHRAMLNVDRWRNGADDFGDDLVTYRTYMINHEVGHALDQPHEDCPTPDEPAPIMMQQTKTTGACQPNGWPYPG